MSGRRAEVLKLEKQSRQKEQSAQRPGGLRSLQVEKLKKGPEVRAHQERSNHSEEAASALKAKWERGQPEED